MASWTEIFGDGRAEDGKLSTCGACGVETHLYDDDYGICPGCAFEGWHWLSAYLVRRGDVVKIGDRTAVITAEEDFDLKVGLYAGDDVMWVKRKTDKVLVKEAV